MNKKEFYNSLSEDVKAKIKACKSEEEMMRVLDAEKIELDPELLDEVSGGGGPIDCPLGCSPGYTNECAENC